jgi:hypothetical protein
MKPLAYEKAWELEIAKRIADLDSGKAKTTPWEEVRARNLAKLPVSHRASSISKIRAKKD